MNRRSTDTTAIGDGAVHWASCWLSEPAVLRHPDPAAERRFWRSAADAASRGSAAREARREGRRAATIHRGSSLRPAGA